MSNLPYMQFYPSDFLIDCQILSMKERGALITLLSYIWINSKTGTIRLSNADLSNLWSLEQNDSNALLCGLWDKGIFNMKRETPPEEIYKDDQSKIINIITSRRITIDKNKLRNSAERQKKHYQKSNAYPNAHTNAEPNINLTPKKLDVRSQKLEVRKDIRINTLAQAPKSPTFSKPTVEEITAYAKGMGFDLNSSRFWDFYESNGWRVGKNPMKNWKAAVRTWRNNDYGGSNASNGGASKSDGTAFIRRFREAQGLRKADFEGPAGKVLSGIRDSQMHEEHSDESNGAHDQEA